MSTRKTSAAAPRANRLLPTATRLLNPLVLRLAGTRLLPIYGTLMHRGRRSGKGFQTPVVVQRIGDGFIIARSQADAGWGVVDDDQTR